MIRAWPESAVAGGVPAKSEIIRRTRREGSSLREVIFTPSRGSDNNETVREAGRLLTMCPVSSSPPGIAASREDCAAANGLWNMTNKTGLGTNRINRDY